MIKLSKGTREGLKKTFSVLTAVTTILSLSGVMLVPVAGAATPADYGLREGDVVSAAGSDDPDVYIVNEHGFKRLFLNPAIFGFYGHLGGFSAVKNVSPATRDAFGTSGLFRNCETGDQKVYGVETTGEDTGMLHWVNTSGAQAVADDANFFKKVFCINNNEFNWYSKGSDYSSVNQVPNYSRTPGPGSTPTPAPSGPLSVMVAPGNPVGQTITKNSIAIEYLKVRFSGSGTVNTVTLKRMGAGATGDFDNVYLYDGATRLTSGKSLSSSNGEVTFVNLNLSVNGTRDLTAVGDMNGTAGNVNSLSLTAVGATGSVSGLPVNGNNMTVSGATSGALTLAKVGSLGNPQVGAKKAQLSEFKITADTEAASVKKITLLQGGTLKPGDLNNVVLSTGTTEWSGSVTKDGHVVFDLGTGFTIVKGGNSTFKVWGDLGGKVDETVKLYFEENLDIWGVGDQYGFPMTTTITTMDAVGEAHALTLAGGTLTITFNGPNAANVGTDTSDTVVMKFAMTAKANIEVRKTEFTLCHDDGGEGTYNNSADTTNGWADVDDFKVVDEDSGVVVLGPQDGSAFTTSDAATCPNSTTGAQKSFTDVFDLSAGVARNFKVSVDVKTANTRSGTALTADDKFKVVLDDYTDDTPDLAIMKYPDTNTSVADADIVPGSDMSGNEMTVSASSLTVGLAGTPGSQTFVKGTKNVDVVGITFAANQSSDLKVTDVTLTGYASDNTTTFDEGTDVTDTSISVANAMTNFRLVEAESGNTIADSSKISTNNLNVQNTGTVKFSFAGTPWTIQAGATKTLLVKVDLSTNAASGTAGDAYSFDLVATTDVTAIDSSNNTVNPGAVAVNGTTSPTKKLTVKESGSMTLATHADSAAKGAVYWGQVDAPISKFSLTATNEGQYMEKLTIAASAAAEIVDAAANVKSVKLTYKNKAGSTLTTSQLLTNTASANFGWSYGGSGTDTRPYVPKDGSLDIDVAASMRTKAEGATQDSNSAVFFSLDLQDTYNNSYANGFKAVGEGSGAVIDGTGTNINDVLGANDQYVYRVFPKLEQVALPSPYNLTGSPTVFKFSITAMGLADSKLRFDNITTGEPFASGAIKFEVVSSGQVTAGGGGTSTQFSVLDEAGVLVVNAKALNRSVNGGNNFATNDAEPGENASIQVDFSSKIIEISGGQTKTFSIRLDNPSTNYAKTSNTGRAADYFQVRLMDEPDNIRWVGNHDGTTNSLDTSSTTGVLRSLPLYGPTFQR